MAMWLYQLTAKYFDPRRYRLEIWEQERWRWETGERPPVKDPPKPGDTVVFYYTPAGNSDPGFYGWAVILDWYSETKCPMSFRPVAPSDRLKMDPWWEGIAERVANRIRGKKDGKVRRTTLQRISSANAAEVRRGIAQWLARDNRRFGR
jgi:hypothetical protein